MNRNLSLAHRLTGAAADHADAFLAACSDSTGATPLLADFLDMERRAPLRLPDQAGRGELVLCNIAGQVNLLRTLHALSVLRYQPAYHRRALDILRFALGPARKRRGMIYWGNHAGIDLLSRKPVFLRRKGKVHELKAHYPPYALLHEADPAGFSDYIPHYWHGHMYDWSRLDFSRHGRMDLPDTPLPADPWGAAYAGGPAFFIGGGLTFLNAGSDLYLAGAELGRLTGAPGALAWAERLMRRYVETRNPETGMGGYVFSSIFDKHDPAHARSADRARVQFLDQFPDHNPLEGTLSTLGAMQMIVGPSVLCRLYLARALGKEAGAPFGRAAVEDCEAYAAWSYDLEAGLFHPLFTDGFRLTGLTIGRDGYFGKAGRVFEARPGNALLFWSFAAAWRYSGNPLLWKVARRIGLGCGLGDIGATPGEKPRLEPVSDRNAVPSCFGLLELDEAFPGGGFLEAAAQIAEGLTAGRKGPLFADADKPFVSADRAEPLALLHVAARLAGRSGELPPFFGHGGLETFEGWEREEESDPVA